VNVSPDVLARCLESVRSGQLTTDECVAAHPEIAAELRPILEVAASLRPPPLAPMDPIARARGRAALIAAMASEDPAIEPLAGSRYLHAVLAALTRPNNLINRSARLRALPVAVTIVLAIALGGGAVAASAESLPGDPLYPVKLTVENVQLAAAPNDAARAQLSLQQAGSRVDEIDRASRFGRADAIGTAAASYIQSVTNANQHLAKAAASGQNVEGLATGLNNDLASQRTALEADENVAPTSARAALIAAARAASLGISVSRGGSGAGGFGIGRPESQSPTPTPAVAAAVSLVTPTRASDPEETVAPTRTVLIRPTERPEPTKTDVPHQGESSRDADPTKVTGSGNGDRGNDGHGNDAHAGDHNGHEENRTPTATPVKLSPPTATAKPSRGGGPEKTPKPTKTSDHGSDHGGNDGNSGGNKGGSGGDD
jgi:hypothetical protein